MQQTHELTANAREELLSEIAATFSNLSREAKIALIMQMLQSANGEKANA